MKSKDIIKVENLEKIELNEFTIRWNLTYLCNYRCDFCIQGDANTHVQKSKNESIEIRKKICENLINFIENQLNNKFNYIELYLIGGEITILPDFLEIVEKIVNCEFKGKIIVRITTNLSTKTEVLNQLVNLFKIKRKYMRELRITASFYKEFAKEEEFMEKVKLLKSNNKISILKNTNDLYRKFKKMIKIKKAVKVFENIENKVKNITGKIYIKVSYPLCNDEDYNEYIKLKKKYKKLKIDVQFIIIKGYKTTISENLKKKIINDSKKNENIKVTFKNGEIFYFSNNSKISLILDEEEKFKSKGYLCDIGINSITISNLGVVSRCVSCKKETIIGNILDGNLVLPTHKIICPSLTCNCSYYKVIEKNESI